MVNTRFLSLKAETFFRKPVQKFAQGTKEALQTTINKGSAYLKLSRNELKFAQKASIPPERFIEMKNLGLGTTEITRAKELGVSAEKLFELKQLGIHTKEKTLQSSEELLKLARENYIHPTYGRNYIWPGDFQLLNRGTTHPYSSGIKAIKIQSKAMGHYAKTVVQDDGTMLKTLSNGITVRIKTLEDGSRVRELFNIFDNKFYSDRIKTSVINNGSTTSRVKDKVFNSEIIRKSDLEFPYQKLSNYQESYTRTYNPDGKLIERRLDVDGGHEIVGTGKHQIEGDLKKRTYIQYPKQYAQNKTNHIIDYNKDGSINSIYCEPKSQSGKVDMDNIYKRYEFWDTSHC